MSTGSDSGEDGSSSIEDLYADLSLSSSVTPLHQQDTVRSILSRSLVDTHAYQLDKDRAKQVKSHQESLSSYHVAAQVKHDIADFEHRHGLRMDRDFTKRVRGGALTKNLQLPESDIYDFYDLNPARTRVGVPKQPPMQTGPSAEERSLRMSTRGKQRPPELVPHSIRMQQTQKREQNKFAPKHRTSKGAYQPRFSLIEPFLFPSSKAIHQRVERDSTPPPVKRMRTQARVASARERVVAEKHERMSEVVAERDAIKRRRERENRKKVLKVQSFREERLATYRARQQQTQLLQEYVGVGRVKSARASTRAPMPPKQRSRSRQRSHRASKSVSVRPVQVPKLALDGVGAGGYNSDSSSEDLTARLILTVRDSEERELAREQQSFPPNTPAYIMYTARAEKKKIDDEISESMRDIEAFEIRMLDQATAELVNRVVNDAESSQGSLSRPYSRLSTGTRSARSAVSPVIGVRERTGRLIG